jgi:hypothetical protein
MLLLGIVTGCTAPQQFRVPSAVIDNRTGRNLPTVLYRSCAMESAEWLPLFEQGNDIAPHRQVEFKLPLDCLDLKALFADGRIAGTQQNIQRRFPFRWVLE